MSHGAHGEHGENFNLESFQIRNPRAHRVPRGFLQKMKIIIVGCGFVGLQTARLFHNAGWEVIGVTHSPESAQNLASEPFRVIACDIADENAMQFHRADLLDADAAIHCASSGRGGVEEYRRVYFCGLQNVLNIWNPKRILFTSSTSVYAQSDSSHVTEKSPAEPLRETGRILREAENLALGFLQNPEVAQNAQTARSGFVARLAGIYGPGRSVLLQKFFDGSAVIEGDGSRIINQIHRDDAARALFFLIEKNAPSGIYNVCDDTPLTQLEIYRALAEHFEKPLPPRGAPNPNRKRGLTSKRVSNAKLRALGWQPTFPSFLDALKNDAELLASLSQ